jgi:hypothetical protein
MSYIKAKVLGVTPRADRNTGEIVNRVQLEVILTESSRLPVDAGVIQAYTQAKDKTMLVPAEFRVIDGRSFLVITGDGYPIPFQDRNSPPTETQASEPEKTRPANSMFGASK